MNLGMDVRTKGFTLVEILITLTVLGVLAAIVAPNLLGLLNRQRMNAVRGEILLALEQAQSNAKTTGSDQVVRFDTTADPPRYSIGTSWRNFNGISAGQIRLVTTAPSIQFNHQGLPDQEVIPFIATVSLVNFPNSKKCVMVKTLLGAMGTYEDSQCD